MVGWTAQRVAEIAPDSASEAAGRGLASDRHWASLGIDENALFGECKGSGAKPYQVRVDLSEPAFKCSCPSRKFPCKHAIGLLLLHVAGSVKPAAKPAWVAEWLTERAARADKKREKAEAPPKPVDAEAQAARREKRLDRVAEGLVALRRWAADLVRGGIACAPSLGYDFFDAQARRLVDAQAPGAARRVQTLAAVASSGPGWQSPFLEQLAQLHLLAIAFERRDTLAPELRDTVLATLGLQPAQEEVLRSPAIADRWLVVAQETRAEDKVIAQHSWLWGVKTRRPVLVLAYAFGAARPDSGLVAGFAFEGEVCAFPGRTLRGLVKTKGALTPPQAMDGPASVEEMIEHYAALRSDNPWLEGVGLCLRNATPALVGDTWNATDAAQASVALQVSASEAWRLAAVSGGHAIDLVGVFDGRRLRALSVFCGSELVRLAASEREAAA